MTAPTIRAIGFDYVGVLARLRLRDVQYPELDPAMLTLVDQLRAAGYKVGLLSNLDGQWAADLRASEAPRHFDVVALAEDTGHLKPEPRAFEHLAASLEVSPSELAFIDDQPGYLTELPALGAHPIVFTAIDQLKADLRQLGVHWNEV